MIELYFKKIKKRRGNEMDDCIFCKIANGVFGSATVYEDEDFRAEL